MQCPIMLLSVKNGGNFQVDFHGGSRFPHHCDEPRIVVGRAVLENAALGKYGSPSGKQCNFRGGCGYTNSNESKSNWQSTPCNNPLPGLI